MDLLAEQSVKYWKGWILVIPGGLALLFLGIRFSETSEDGRKASNGEETSSPGAPDEQEAGVRKQKSGGEVHTSSSQRSDSSANHTFRVHHRFSPPISTGFQFRARVHFEKQVLYGSTARSTLSSDRMIDLEIGPFQDRNSGSSREETVLAPGFYFIRMEADSPPESLSDSIRIAFETFRDQTELRSSNVPGKVNWRWFVVRTFHSEEEIRSFYIKIARRLTSIKKKVSAVLQPWEKEVRHLISNNKPGTDLKLPGEVFRKYFLRLKEIRARGRKTLQDLQSKYNKLPFLTTRKQLKRFLEKAPMRNAEYTALLYRYFRKKPPKWLRNQVSTTGIPRDITEVASEQEQSLHRILKSVPRSREDLTRDWFTGGLIKQVLWRLALVRRWLQVLERQMVQNRVFFEGENLKHEDIRSLFFYFQTWISLHGLSLKQFVDLGMVKTDQRRAFLYALRRLVERTFRSVLDENGMQIPAFLKKEKFPGNRPQNTSGEELLEQFQLRGRSIPVQCRFCLPGQ